MKRERERKRGYDSRVRDRERDLARTLDNQILNVFIFFTMAY